MYTVKDCCGLGYSVSVPDLLPTDTLSRLPTRLNLSALNTLYLALCSHFCAPAVQWETKNIPAIQFCKVILELCSLVSSEYISEIFAGYSLINSIPLLNNSLEVIIV